MKQTINNIKTKRTLKKVHNVYVCFPSVFIIKGVRAYVKMSFDDISLQ